MNVTIIGTGYVGLPTGVGLAELGHNVICVDREKSKIDLLQSGKVTLFEKGLEELLKKNYEKGTILFTTSMSEAVKSADIVLIAVGTPPHPVTHEADMQYVYSAATELAEYLDDYTVIATKSTVPVGTGDVLEKIIAKKNPSAKFDVVSLPEFLREGYAVQDFFNPDRIIVGSNSQNANKLIKELYKPFQEKAEILFVKRRSSETIKYASNSFLALKIHYINEIADFCEKTGADVLEVSKGMGLDSRIGNKFLKAGPGFGGSCFPKDLMALSYMAHQNKVNLSLVDHVIEGNLLRKKKFASIIKESIVKINLPKIAILGLAFKEGTDDCRQSPAVEIIEFLLDQLDHKDTTICTYDPKAMNVAKSILSDRVEYANNVYEAVDGADCLVILTEWPEFSELDLSKVKNLMRGNCVLDFRNLLNPKKVQENGLIYRGIGR